MKTAGLALDITIGSGWIFSVEAGGRPVFSMPNRNFDDRQGRNEYVPGPQDHSSACQYARSRSSAVPS